MLDGTTSVGSHTPLAGVPAWVTLEVEKGGFATGGLLAGGPLQEHERALLAQLGRPDGGRAALNAFYLSDAPRCPKGDATPSRPFPGSCTAHRSSS